MNKKKKTLILFILILLQIVILFGISLSLQRMRLGNFLMSPRNLPVQERITKHFAPPGQKIQIKNPLGKVIVVGEEREDIYLEGVKTVYGLDEEHAQQLLKELLLEEDYRDGTLFIEVKRSITQGQDAMDLEIYVPMKLDLTIDSSLGKISVENMYNTTDINASMGEVNVQDLVGNLMVRASMGQIIVENTNITQHLDIHASMGTIRFAGQLGQSNSFRANMGNILLEIPQETSVELEGKISMGKFENSLDFTGQKEDNQIIGQLGSGTTTGRLNISSSMGNVTIRGSE